MTDTGFVGRLNGWRCALTVAAHIDCPRRSLGDGRVHVLLLFTFTTNLVRCERARKVR